MNDHHQQQTRQACARRLNLNSGWTNLSLRRISASTILALAEARLRGAAGLAIGCSPARPKMPCIAGEFAPRAMPRCC